MVDPSVFRSSPCRQYPKAHRSAAVSGSPGQRHLSAAGRAGIADLREAGNCRRQPSRSSVVPCRKDPEAPVPRRQQLACLANAICPLVAPALRISGRPETARASLVVPRSSPCIKDPEAPVPRRQQLACQRDLSAGRIGAADLQEADSFMSSARPFPGRPLQKDPEAPASSAARLDNATPSVRCRPRRHHGSPGGRQLQEMTWPIAPCIKDPESLVVPHRLQLACPTSSVRQARRHCGSPGGHQLPEPAWSFPGRPLQIQNHRFPADCSSPGQRHMSAGRASSADPRSSPAGGIRKHRSRSSAAQGCRVPRYTHIPITGFAPAKSSNKKDLLNEEVCKASYSKKSTKTGLRSIPFFVQFLVLTLAFNNGCI
ncbi:hypothetical protein HMPREF1207_05614 [Paenibacillus sp. HGH0039]|nr:hypothetical protein HMPREF1207_05614 [Paenibacillus sp. HGH0039]